MKKHIIISSVCITVYLLFASQATGQVDQSVKEAGPAMTISGFQMNVTTNIKDNKDQIMKGITRAEAEGASFLATPEGSLSGYTSNFKQSEVSMALKEILSVAAKMKVGLLLSKSLPGMETKTDGGPIHCSLYKLGYGSEVQSFS